MGAGDKGKGQGQMPPNIIEIRWHDLGHTTRIGFQWDILRTRDFQKDPV